MQYHFATIRQNYSNYASGRVFYGVPGQPTFPVRLASEIFQRCLAIRQAEGVLPPCCFYDPCCGGAYHLSVLAYLHWNAINEIIASDIDEKVLSFAERNLALLTIEGMNRRIAEISQMLASYGKTSHASALESAKILRRQLRKQIKTHTIKTNLFHADVHKPSGVGELTDSKTFRERFHKRKVDIVISDIPYGQLSKWQVPDSTLEDSPGPVWHMLETLRPILSSEAVVAIAANKRPKIAHEQYQRIERFLVGKRQVVLLQPIHFNA